MTSRPSRFPAAAKRRRPAKLGSGPVAMIVASLFAAAVFFQPPAHSAGATPANASAEAAVARSSDSATRVAELEKGFWICDYLGTNQGADTQQAATCIANFEEFKQTKFGGDFEKLVTWWRLNKIAQHKALESSGSAQY